MVNFQIQREGNGDIISGMLNSLVSGDSILLSKPDTLPRVTGQVVMMVPNYDNDTVHVIVIEKVEQR